MRNYYGYNNDDYLMHFGVKGMKWGVRRYQNPDGSYTAAGQGRYSGGKVSSGSRGGGRSAGGASRGGSGRRSAGGRSGRLKRIAKVAGAAALAGAAAYGLHKSGLDRKAFNAIKNSKAGQAAVAGAGKVRNSKFGQAVGSKAGFVAGKARDAGNAVRNSKFGQAVGAGAGKVRSGAGFVAGKVRSGAGYAAGKVRSGAGFVAGKAKDAASSIRNRMKGEAIPPGKESRFGNLKSKINNFKAKHAPGVDRDGVIDGDYKTVRQRVKDAAGNARDAVKNKFTRKNPYAGREANPNLLRIEAKDRSAGQRAKDAFNKTRNAAQGAYGNARNAARNAGQKAKSAAGRVGRAAKLTGGLFNYKYQTDRNFRNGVNGAAAAAGMATGYAATMAAQDRAKNRSGKQTKKRR